ncbi:YbaB/EbfC DNA-binding family protein [Micromonospora pisi]|uniref:YbaB/EbfC DNA-binding family protein n=1 Tax=Micromonospora pisi TaxID=589240 RepID=A0A495JCJ9_9ACTN|nr:YbaB/EbfC family nucleoid-associated protein [Micromonospora pisi]RKR86736.1 YbaB/EbfC DNA-binding family protein [Micromonospora pisi]
MSSPLQNRIEQAFAEFEQQKIAISGIERKIEAAKTTVTAKNRAVTVTVDGRGDLVEVKFPTNAYRTMPPAELGSLLVETTKAAREQAREGAAELFQTILPAGMPILDMLNGSVDFDEMMSEAMRAANEPFPGAASSPNRPEESR